MAQHCWSPKHCQSLFWCCVCQPTVSAMCQVCQHYQLTSHAFSFSIIELVCNCLLFADVGRRSSLSADNVGRHYRLPKWQPALLADVRLASPALGDSVPWNCQIYQCHELADAVMTVAVHSVLLPSMQLRHHSEERHIQHVSWRSARSVRQPRRTCSRDADSGTNTWTAPYWSPHCWEQLVWRVNIVTYL